MRVHHRNVTLLAALAGVACLLVRVDGSRSNADDGSIPTDLGTLSEAYVSFYNGRYVEAADQALAVRVAQPADLAGYEIRASALLFQLKRELAGRSRVAKDVALAQCGPCGQWTAAFLDETGLGQRLARTSLAANHSDEQALYFLAKLDLNYVWLQLELLGHKKGWNEYWEARRSLDALLTRNPAHVRGRVARAWIDYIVATRLPGGTRWVLGGGNRTRALRTMRQAASADASFFVHAEASFALWDVEVREHHFPEALAVARRLARDFPANRDLTEFLALHEDY